MPAFPPASTLGSLHDRGSVDDLSATVLAASNTSNTTHDALQVVCAWPLSGQYGPGSRVLYYVLIAACVIARKEEWLKNPCLAAALLFPAIAALHGIVLAALHVDGAVDMDVYGAFQLCSLGIVAAPVTVALSRTYFNIRGRNTIFLWVGLILAGLLSLTIEFYRIETTGCATDDDGNPISSRASQFPYDKAPSCGLVCSEDEGPRSPMRKDANKDIYVIPAPTRLTFGTATLLSAACCVHALIWMASMSDKILQRDWLRRFRDNDVEERIHEEIEGTNGATEGKMRNVNEMVRFFLSIAVIPVFSGIGLALLIVGEINFFSQQVDYQTEPMTSVGQWGPIVGTGFAVVGSLYLLLAADVEAVREGIKIEGGSTHHCDCSHHHVAGDGHGFSPAHSSIDPSRSSRDARRAGSPQRDSTDVPARPQPTRQLTGRTMAEQGGEVTRTISTDSGYRARVAQGFVSFGDWIGAATRGWVDDSSEFKSGKALDFPEIPGEENRNRELARIREQYNPPRDGDGNVTPLPHEGRSRPPSFIGSVHSAWGPDEGLGLRRTPSPSGAGVGGRPLIRRAHSNSLPPIRTTSEPQHPLLTPTTSGSSPGLRPPQRSATLEVPSLAHYGHGRYNSASLPMAPNAGREKTTGQSSPAVMKTSEAGPSAAKRPSSPQIPESPSPPNTPPPRQDRYDQD